MTSPPCNYVESPDIPEGMTITDYRRTRADRPARRRRIMRIFRARAPRAARRTAG
jgi:hypothetical protein